MSLIHELDALRESELAKTSPAVRDIFQQAMEHLKQTGVSERALVEGDAAPTFELSDLSGEVVRLADLVEQGPVILDFFRGSWCPFCNIELHAYQQIIHRIQAVKASLVAISPEIPEVMREVYDQNSFSFPLLSDPNLKTARRYGLVYTLPEALREVYEGFGLDLPARTASASFDLPIPATYLVDQHGIIRRAFLEIDHTRRAEPEEFLAGIHELRASP